MTSKIHTSKLFSGQQHTKIYQQFRPSYPQSLYAQILAYNAKYTHFQQPFNTILDLGCGSLQNTKHLVKLGKQVYGTDIEEAQIERAQEIVEENQWENVDLRVAPAEKLEFLPDESIELCTVAQALHWMNFEALWMEMDRVLKPNGLFSAWCYQLTQFHNDEVQKELEKLYRDILGPYWAGNRALIDSHYSTVQWPSYACNVEQFVVKDERRMPLAFYINYLKTWSSYQLYCKSFPSVVDTDDDPVHQFRRRVMEIENLESDEEEVSFVWPQYLYIFHKGRGAEENSL